MDYQHELVDHLDGLIDIGIQHSNDLVAVLAGTLATMLIIQIGSGDIEELHRLKNYLLKWEPANPNKRTYTFVGEIKN